MDALGSVPEAAPPKILTQAAHRLFEASPALISWTIILSPIAVAFLFGWAGAFAVAVGVLVFDAYWLIRCFWVIFGIVRTFRKLRRTMAIDWLARCREDEEAGSLHPLAVTHLCIIPTYTEPYAVLEATLRAIAEAKYPRESKLVAIITRETDHQGWENVERLRLEFGSQLGAVYHVKDPLEPGVVPGKSAAMNWGGRWMSRVLREEGRDLRQIMCTDLDSDYRVHPQYFAWLSWFHVRDPLRDTVIWQPIPLFHNNIWQVPTAIRVLSGFISQWQMYMHSRPHRLVAFSSYSCTMQFADDVGYWDKDVIPEDSRFYWKAFFRFGKEFAVRPVFLPIYGDAPKSKDYAASHASQYNQIKRWAWGITDVSYVMARFFKHPEIPLRLRLMRFGNLFSNHMNWVFLPVMLTFGSSIPVWASVDFSITDTGATLWADSGLIMSMTVSVIFILIFLEALILPTKPPHWGLFRRWWVYPHYFLYPMVAIVLMLLPALEAHTRLLLGKYLEYRVTEKGT